MSLQALFDPKRNALNSVRLTMAIGVIVWHSYPLTGHDIRYAPVRQFLAEVWVDGFFAISGYLITSSWVRRPEIRAYLTARAIRILPAFYVCLILTAYLVAPLGVAMQGGDAKDLLSTSAPTEYVTSNLGIWIFQRGIGDTPENVPYPGSWNGSLWTLSWEVLCYIAIAIIGTIGLLKRKFFIPMLTIAIWAVLLTSTFQDVPGTIENGARFAIMFLTGTLIFQYQDRIPCNWPLVVLATGVTCASMFLSDYRLVGAIFWAYAVISTGALIKNKHLRFKNDISYGTYIYAFPIQQLLVIGIGPQVPIYFAIIATALTLPIAALSWFIIERPTIRAKRRRDIKAKTPVPVCN